MLTAVIEWVLIVALAGSVIWLIVRDHRREMAAVSDWPNDTGWLDDLIAAEETPFYDDLCIAWWENELADGERA